MNKTISYLITGDILTLVSVQDGEIRTVTESTDPLTFRKVRDMLDEGRDLDAWELIESVQHWMLKNLPGVYEDPNGRLMYEDVELPEDLYRLIKGRDGGDRWKTFLGRLLKNPSRRVVDHLYRFISACDNVTVDDAGYVIAFKGVGEDFRDRYSGEYDNSPGQEHEMARNLVSDDPDSPCSYGFHVGSLTYARDYGKRVVIVRVDPADVVCVPYDHSGQKMRVCRYKVMSEFGESREGQEDAQEVMEGNGGIPSMESDGYPAGQGMPSVRFP